ncbi:Cof-type HAD-IIB family hydrolase [Vagococcus lutrae]|uniref:Cof-type HAD-IIB family hydrolase n=1 Tax=Vagococcus lutrae TaxID=81947 RepID=UPI00200BC82C|nr:Cof-type HAD-IIB family hydrolase [Vagococcus lutrae]MDT2806352.1 Cof-type HAD-IIB family hydrolase [Vagococcus lutrae]MDT2823383.1 Cof-type HAD-IIB family hydrolase [Vagococcus lutrae]UQF18572.1 Cof-type HAD-IIB family hydrolase [Vagococcus lutrae]
MKNIKGFAFFDLDGTLLNHQSEVDEQVASALVALKNNGIIPVIATGRTNTEIQHVLDDTVIESSITMNGQYVLFEGEEIYSDLISSDVVDKMLQKTAEKGHQLGLYNEKGITISEQTPAVKVAYEYIHQGMPEENAKRHWEEPINMMLIIGKDQDAFYHKHFPELTFFRNGPYTIDVISKGGSKGRGVAKFVEHIGLTDIPTYGFGDGPNDMDLLAACDYKIAMGNAIPSLKEQADFVTKANTDNGIVHALKHFNLI